MCMHMLYASSPPGCQVTSDSKDTPGLGSFGDDLGSAGLELGLAGLTQLVLKVLRTPSNPLSIWLYTSSFPQADR